MGSIAKTRSINSTTSVSAVLDPSVNVDVERPARRLNWCHGAGSVTVAVTCDDGSCTYLLVSEPQVAVLFAFNATVNSVAEDLLDEKTMSTGELSSATGLSLRE